MGGLSKKSFQIHSLIEQGKNNQLRLDAGNLLFKRPVIAKGPGQEKLTAATIMQAYKKLHYDAVGVGPFDLSAGVQFLQNVPVKGFPWISANVFDKEGKPLFRRWKNRTINGVNIAITALTGAANTIPQDIQISSWDLVLPGLLEEMKSLPDNSFIILLSTLPAEENRLIAEKHPRINLILEADLHQRNSIPKQVNRTLFTQTEKQGKYQGILEILFGDERMWRQDGKKKLAELQNKLGSLNWQLRRLEKSAVAADKKEQYSNSIKRLQNEKLTLTKTIDSLTREVADEQAAGTKEDQYEFRFIALQKNMPNDPAIEVLLKKLNQQIRQLHKRPIAPGQHSQATKQQLSTANLVGYAVCRECHTAQFKFWQQSAHAKAYTTLVNKEKNFNLECLPCHITEDLYNSTPKTTDNRAMLSLPVTLLSVGCESCHGPGKRHSANPEQFQMTARPQEEICLRCHTEDHDDNFIYDTKILKISCTKE